MNRGRTIAEATRGSLPWREQHLQQSLDRLAVSMGELFPGVNLDRMQQIFDARRKLLKRLAHVQKLREREAQANHGGQQ